MLTIYHNPRCSKSRQALEILNESGCELSVIEYLHETPDAARILDLAGLLQLPVAGLLRRGEEEFKKAADLPELTDDAALARWIAQHPKTLQRPIIVDEQRSRAVIGRPPENVLELVRS
jgi:arsenate reductase